MANDPSPAIAGVLETCLYAVDLVATARFYSEVLGLESFAEKPERHVFFRVGRGVFLLFNPERTSLPPEADSGTPVLTHGAYGPGHVAFAVGEASLPAWRARLASEGVPIEAEVTWPGGGRSLYLRDPAGNSVELGTPRIWGLPDPERASGGRR